MLKKGQLSIFIIIALLIVTSIVIKFFLSRDNSQIKLECQVDSQCFPSDCCHAASCVPVERTPSCSGVVCTQNCAPGTLDCQQATCRCVNNKCKVIQN